MQILPRILLWHHTSNVFKVRLSVFPVINVSRPYSRMLERTPNPTLKKFLLVKSLSAWANLHLIKFVTSATFSIVCDSVPQDAEFIHLLHTVCNTYF